MKSVIIPAYNEERYLPETLRRIITALSVTDRSSEIIVVDNDSMGTSHHGQTAEPPAAAKPQDKP